jgi:hypothetical protein
MELITIEIDATGDTQISVQGIPGKKCMEATAELERRLGRKTHDQPTPEMRETVRVKA